MSNAFSYKKLLLPGLIIVATVALIMLIITNPPTAKRNKVSKSPQMTVETITITPQTYQVLIDSFGTVKPRTQSVLSSQVSGHVNWVNKQFKAGGFFEQGDVLITLDDRDYRAEVSIAKSSLLSAKQNLEEELARVKQAKADWRRLGNNKPANDLVLRKPQYEAAKAQVSSAQALLTKANLALERTKIVAPYAGRILNKHIDIGQVISSNTQLADIFAVDYVEIRLPIKNKDLPLMKLPEEYRNNKQTSQQLPVTKATTMQANIDLDSEAAASDVIISSDLLGEQQWQGKIIRTESAIDETSQQLYVVAQINHPYDIEHNQSGQIKIGQYVSAKITGRTINNALVIPSKAIYQGSYVYIVNDGLLMRKAITLGWQNGIDAIVKTGLVAGDELVLTSLGQISSGTAVTITSPSTTESPAKIKTKNHPHNKTADMVDHS